MQDYIGFGEGGHWGGILKNFLRFYLLNSFRLFYRLHFFGQLFQSLIIFPFLLIKRDYVNYFRAAF